MKHPSALSSLRAIPAPAYATFRQYTSGLNSRAYPENRLSINWSLKRRGLSTDSRSGEFDQDKVVDLINIKFAEAREEIEMAMESKETVYFDEEAECARAAVKKVLDLFEGLLGKLPESGRAALQRSMGLKIEQLKSELKQLDE